MPVLAIGDRSVTVGDEFLKLSPDQQNAAVADIAKSIGPIAAPAAPAEKPLGYDPTDSRFANPSVAATLRGVPLLGAGVEKAAAGLSALAHPVTGVGSDKSTLAERYVENLAQEEAAKADYETKHPIKSAVEGMVGGTLALGGAGGASPAIASALGMTGKLVPAALRATASGAAIGAGDAALRGADPVTGGEVGALTGVGGVVAGKGIGKVWDAARGMFREAAAPTPTRTIDVNGRQVPVRESVITRDPAASEREQKAIHGGEGTEAQAVARAHGELTDAEMAGAHGDLAASLDPTGARPEASPMAAGEAIGTEVSAQEAARAAAEAQRLQAVAGEQQQLRGDLNTSATPGVLAENPRSAGQQISEALIGARDRVAAARDRAYEALRGTAGEFSPAVFRNTAARIRQDLNRGTDPVRVDAQVTPHTAAALQDIDLNVGQLRFENQAQAPLQRGPDGRPVAPPITADTIDAARKRLISMQRAANDTARRTGDFSDVRGVRRVIEAFDQHVSRATQTPGGFSGDPRELLDRLGQARGLHAALKRTFGPQNPQDDVGKAIEKIVGKRNVTPAEIETVAPLLFGPSTEPGGALQARIARRMVDIYGRDSREVAALKQGLISHIADTPAGMEPLSHAKVADRIHRFFSGTKGVGLAQELFSPSERARLLAHANRMRGAHDPEPAGFVEKTVAKWAGRDGGLRASPKTIIDDLLGSTGQKGTAPALVRHLRDQLSPEAFGTLKQGVWSRITEGAEGTIPWKDQKVGQRIMNFLNGDGKGMADALFTKAERDAMRNIADAHIANLPIEGTTNPSKSGHVMERLARSAAHGILPFVGLHAGGLPGVAVALAANKGVGKAVDRAAAVRAQRLFYGDQPRRAASQLPQRFGALGGALVANQSR